MKRCPECGKRMEGSKCPRCGAGTENAGIRFLKAFTKKSVRYVGYIGAGLVFLFDILLFFGCFVNSECFYYTTYAQFYGWESLLFHGTMWQYLPQVAAVYNVLLFLLFLHTLVCVVCLMRRKSPTIAVNITAGLSFIVSVVLVCMYGSFRSELLGTPDFHYAEGSCTTYTVLAMILQLLATAFTVTMTVLGRDDLPFILFARTIPSERGSRGNRGNQGSRGSREYGGRNAEKRSARSYRSDAGVPAERASYRRRADTVSDKGRGESSSNGRKKRSYRK